VILGKISGYGKGKLFSIEDMPIGGKHIAGLLAGNLVRTEHRVSKEEARLPEYTDGPRVVLSLTDFSNRDSVQNIRYYQTIPSFLFLAEAVVRAAMEQRLSPGDRVVFTEEKGNEASGQVQRSDPGMKDVWRTVTVKSVNLEVGPSIIIDLTMGRAKKLDNGMRVPDGLPKKALSIVASVEAAAEAFLSAQLFVQASVAEAMRQATAEALRLELPCEDEDV